MGSPSIELQLKVDDPPLQSFRAKSVSENPLGSDPGIQPGFRLALRLAGMTRVRSRRPTAAASPYHTGQEHRLQQAQLT